MIRDNDSLTLVLRAEGTYDHGEYAKGIITGFVIMRCSVQPTSGKDLEFLPEGERERVRYTAYLSNDVTLSQHDTAMFNGIEYKVLADQQWNTPYIDHNKLFLAEIA